VKEIRTHVRTKVKAVIRQDQDDGFSEGLHRLSKLRREERVNVLCHKVTHYGEVRIRNVSLRGGVRRRRRRRRRSRRRRRRNNKERRKRIRRRSLQW